MNADNYFENDPWSRSAALVRAGRLGRLAAVAIEEVCEAGGAVAARDRWIARLADLLGAPVRADELRAAEAISVLARYPGDVVVRLFIDQSPAAATSSFEIVGEDALLVWKPDVRALAISYGPGGASVCLAHPYADSLDVPAGARR